MKRLLTLALLIACATSAFAIKITYGPYVQAVTKETVTIVWGTDKTAISWVETAPHDKSHFYAEERPKFFQTVLGRKLPTKYHSITIPNPNTNGKAGFRYRAYSQEITSNKGGRTMYGRVASTRIFSYRHIWVKTLDYAKKSVDFVLMNDQHGNDGVYELLNKRVNRKKTDAVLFVGDMASGIDTKQTSVYHKVSGRVNNLKNAETPFHEVPLFMTRGVNESVGKLGMDYLTYFPTSTGKPYYTVRYGSVCFIVLDSGVDKKDKAAGTDFESYRKEQAAWLAKALESEDVKGAKFKVALMHIPPVAGVSPVSKELNSLFVPILEKAGINLMICGYTHNTVMHEANKKCSFPILENGSSTLLNIRADEEKMAVIVEDLEGNVKQNYAF
ncbi:MAG: metallophosphoesterase [Alistipes sp.]|nr:metallophosphoesterase [Alistipes sp.]MBR0340292.1 metallophosphoesterase [Alistipes sp.]